MPPALCLRSKHGGGAVSMPTERWQRRRQARGACVRAGAQQCGSGSEPAAPAQQQQQQQQHLLQGRLSVYAISDLHTDYAANMQWVQSLRMRDGGSNANGSSSSSSSGGDGVSAGTSSHFSVLIVAGDVSDDVRVLRDTLAALTRQFDLVAFVPGNHCLWVKGPDKQQRNGGASDSLAKLAAVNALCAELGVLTAPALLGGLALLPLLAWHHQSWDREPDIPGIPRAGAMTIADYAACVWPPETPGAGQLGSEGIAAALDALNEQQPGWAALQRVLSQAQRAGGSSAAGGLELITFSHFLPHQELLPEKRLLSFPNLAKAVGSDWLARRLQQLQPVLHVFGHSHFSWDATVQGVRCLQAPLCYPAERQHRLKSLIIGADAAAEAAQQTQQKQQQQQQQLVAAWHHGPPLRRQQHAHGRSHEALHRPSPQHVGLAEQHARDACGWLPVRVYEAVYTAELAVVSDAAAAAAAATNGSVCGLQQRLMHGGVPVLHPAALLLQQQQEQSVQQQQQPPLQEQQVKQQQQQQQEQSVQDQQRAPLAPAAYVVRSWAGAWCPNLRAMWSDYYASNARDPANTQLAPWVAKRYSRQRRRAHQAEAPAAAAARQAAG